MLTSRRFLLGTVILVAVGGPFCWFFGPVLGGQKTFVFRDAAHYYYPLFQWTSQQWGQGRIPLWNPLDRVGVPAAADATSSVFYPGKLIFAAPVEFSLAYNLFIALHVLLAAAGAFRLARRMGVSALAAAVCCVSYAYSGNVLFQYCNVVFLVGAAWLPWALLAVDVIIRRRSVRKILGAVIGLGAALAMMVLGGDPQMAYHVGLLAVGYAWIARRRRMSPRRKPFSRPPRLVLLAAAGVIGLVLSAVQVFPSLAWSAKSQRAAYDTPRTIYEAVDWKQGRFNAEGLWKSPSPGVHHEQMYHFSVGPWRWPELVWPHFAGRFFPVHRRWMNVIPAEGRVWTPTLYMGLLPLLLAVVSFRFRKGPPMIRWCSWAAIWAVLAALGWCGIGWLVREVRYGLAGYPPLDAGSQNDFQVGLFQGLPGEPVGGVYWLMATVLPGYAYFRYPAKLWVVATLCLSLLAAVGWDRVFGWLGSSVGSASVSPSPSGSALNDLCWDPSRPARKLRIGLLVVMAGSMLGGLGMLCVIPFWNRWMSDTAPDDLYGPLVADGAWWEVTGSFLHAAILGVVFYGLLRRLSKNRRWVSIIALLLTAGEITLAQRGLLPTAAIELWRQPSPIVDLIHQLSDSQPIGRVYRTSGAQLRPSDWKSSSSDSRQSDAVRWDRATLAPRYHLPQGIPMAEAPTTITSLDVATFFRVARRHGPKREDGVREPHRSALDLLGVKYLLLPDHVAYPSVRLVEKEFFTPGGERLPNVSLWKNPQALPRVWVVREIEWLPSPPRRDAAANQERTRQVLFPNGQPREWRRSALIESPRRPAFSTNIQPPPLNSFGHDTCRIVRDDPQRIDIVTDLSAPGLLILNDLYDTDWQVEVKTEGIPAKHPATIFRTNRVLRGVWLTAGRHRLHFRYRPQQFYWGAWISGAGWLSLLIAVVGVRWPSMSRDR